MIFNTCVCCGNPFRKQSRFIRNLFVKCCCARAITRQQKNERIGFRVLVSCWQANFHSTTSNIYGYWSCTGDYIERKQPKEKTPSRNVHGLKFKWSLAICKTRWKYARRNQTRCPKEKRKQITQSRREVESKESIIFWSTRQQNGWCWGTGSISCWQTPDPGFAVLCVSLHFYRSVMRGSQFICTQIEYYFGDENFERDFFLRSKVDIIYIFLLRLVCWSLFNL